MTFEAVRASFDRFLTHGLGAVFERTFARAKVESAELAYVELRHEPPRYDAVACARRGLFYAAPLKVTVRLIVFEELEGERVIRNIKEQEVYFGEVPLMTEEGTFVVWGEDRVLLSRPLGERLMRPGEWLAFAFEEGLVVLIETLVARMERARELDTYMPHDLLDAKPVMQAVRVLFDDPARCERAITKNPVLRVEQLTAIHPPIKIKKFNPRSRSKIKPGEPSVVPSSCEELAPFALDPLTARRALTEALVLRDAQAPRVLTGRERAWASAAGLVRVAGLSGELRASDGIAAIVSEDGAARLLEARVHLPNRPWLVDRVAQENGPVSADDVLFESQCAEGGHLSLGRNAHVRFDPAAAGATVSASFARAMRAVAAVVVERGRKDTRLGREERGSVSGDPSGVVAVGAEVAKGDAIIAIRKPTGEVTLESALGLEVAQTYSTSMVRASSRKEGTVVRVDIFARYGAERSERHEASVMERVAALEKVRAAVAGTALELELGDRIAREQRGDDLPPGVIELFRVTIERDVPLALGSRLSDRRGFGASVIRVLDHLDVDVVLPGPAPAEALREIEEARGTLYLMHLPPLRAQEDEEEEPEG